MVAAMDAAGVDGAILVSPFSMYRFDASYALEVYAAHPGRFRLVKPVDQIGWWRQWMPLALMAQSWSRRSACIASTQATRLRFTRRIPAVSGWSSRSIRSDGGGNGCRWR